MSDTPILAFQSVTKTYAIKGRSLQVLDEVSLDIPRGSFTAIKGPSGAGKSTLLYIAGMLLAPDAGKVFIDGKEVETISSLERAKIRNRDIGFIFQSYHLLPEFTALENIVMPALLLGIPKKEAALRAAKLLEKVNLQNREHHKPLELSGGEQQRVCICRALINTPKLILADEPTGNLDTQNAELVVKLLESLCSEFHTSLVVVTHNDDLAERAHNRIRILDGKIK